MGGPATWQEDEVHKHSGFSRLLRNKIPESRFSLLLTEEETKAREEDVSRPAPMRCEALRMLSCRDRRHGLKDALP